MNCYYEDLDRDGAEKILYKQKVDSYLLRKSTLPNYYSLSAFLAEENICHHLLILFNEKTKKYSLQGFDEGKNTSKQ